VRTRVFISQKTPFLETEILGGNLHPAPLLSITDAVRVDPGEPGPVPNRLSYDGNVVQVGVLLRVAPRIGKNKAAFRDQIDPVGMLANGGLAYEWNCSAGRWWRRVRLAGAGGGGMNGKCNRYWLPGLTYMAAPCESDTHGICTLASQCALVCVDGHTQRRKLGKTSRAAASGGDIHHRGQLLTCKCHHLMLLASNEI
jgi:hypothetical protein